jgi:hypothetical protein
MCDSMKRLIIRFAIMRYSTSSMSSINERLEQRHRSLSPTYVGRRTHLGAVS